MIPDYYCYVVDGQTVNEYKVDQYTGQSQLKQIKLWNPLDDFYGCSPILASAYNIDQHNLAGLHNVALLKNGCTPSGMLKFEPKDETGMSATLTDDQRARLLEDLEQRFQGSNNSGRPMLLEGNFDYKQLGLNPKDMDFLELMNMSAREIALCFGVPAQLVGIADQTYANVAEARLSLYEETIIPFGTGSRVSCDSTGNYFNLWLDGYQPERYYSILYRVVSGSGTIEETDQYFDEGFTFKVSL